MAWHLLIKRRMPVRLCVVITSLTADINSVVVEAMMPVRSPLHSAQQQPTPEPAKHWVPCCPKEP